VSQTGRNVDRVLLRDAQDSLEGEARPRTISLYTMGKSKRGKST
jgi:hypothetical protein